MKTDFGGMVRARRRAVGLTLAELSERAGLSANYLQTIEAGTRDVSLSSLEAIATALDVTPGELLGDVQRLTPDALQAGRLIDALEPEAREIALRLLRLLPRGHRPASAPDARRLLNPVKPRKRGPRTT